LVPPGSKYAVLKKVLATLLGFCGAPNDSVPRALFLHFPLSVFP